MEWRSSGKLRGPQALDLNILEGALWGTAQARAHLMEATYRKTAKGTLKTGPDARREGKDLMSGLARCGIYKWHIAVLGREYRRYGCAHSPKRGVCANDFT